MSESLSLSGLEMPFVYRPFRMCKFRDDSHELRLTNAAAAVEGCGAENRRFFQFTSLHPSTAAASIKCNSCE